MQNLILSSNLLKKDQKYPFCIFEKKGFFIILARFKTSKTNADETGEKTEFFYIVLELNFATINGLGKPSC